MIENDYIRMAYRKYLRKVGLSLNKDHPIRQNTTVTGLYGKAILWTGGLYKPEVCMAECSLWLGGLQRRAVLIYRQSLCNGSSYGKAVLSLLTGSLKGQVVFVDR